MSRNIADFANNRAGVRPGEKYGIEVEAEGLPLETIHDHRWSTAFNAYWGTTGDGSLRNGGIEFLSKPLGRTAVRHAINALWPYFEAKRMVPSVRTGIHIHASCLGLNTDQVRQILRHYALVEPVLFNFVGAAREENIYCIPWYRAPSEAEAAHSWLRSWEPMGTQLGEMGEPCKYSALYVAPLSRFGTIEFRHAPTWEDPLTPFRWWQLVQAVWRTHQAEYNVLERYSEIGPAAFCKAVLPFDWLAEPDEALFEDADVETVCSLIGDPPMLTSAEWGRAPELAGPGVAAPPARGRAPRVPEEPGEPAPDYSIEGLIRNRPGPALTVNVGAMLFVDELAEPPSNDDNDDDDQEEF